MRRLSMILFAALVAGCVTMPHSNPFIPCAGATPIADAYSHYLAARVYTRDGDLEKAADELGAAIKKASPSTHLYTDLILLYVRLGDTAKALTLCKEALDHFPADPGLWVRRGWLERQQSEPDLAVVAFRKALELDPDNPIVLARLIQAVDESNDAAAALDIMNSLLELRPTLAPLHHQMGLQLIEIRDLDGAKASFARALELDPSMHQARKMLGMISLDNNDPQGAVEAFDAYLAAEPGDEHALQSLAGAYSRLGVHEKALEALARPLEPVVEAAPVDSEQGEAPPTEEMVDMAGLDAPGANDLYRVYLLLRLGRFQEAAASAMPSEAPYMSALLQAMALKGADAPWKPLLDGMVSVEGDIDAEISSYLNPLVSFFGKEQAAVFIADSLSSMRAEGLSIHEVDLVLAHLYMLLDRYPEAENILMETIAAHGPSKWASIYLAGAYEKRKEFRLAIRQLRTALELDPMDPETMNFLAYMYSEAGVQLEEAERLAKRALEYAPENAYYLDTLGWIAFKRGDAQRAAALIRQAIIRMDSDDPVLRDHLGDVYMKLGDVQKAVNEWERSIKLDPKQDGVRAKLDKHRGKKR